MGVAATCQAEPALLCAAFPAGPVRIMGRPGPCEPLRREREHCAALEGENLALRERIRQLEEEKRELEAKVAGLNQLHFGQKTEKKPPPAAPGPSPGDGQKRRRGHQPGAKGHGRRSHDHLPREVEDVDLPEDAKVCSCCGKPFVPLPETDDAEILEVEVKAHRRMIRRKRYVRSCSCPDVPAVVTPPAAPALIPRNGIGVSIWVTVLLDKFLFLRPTHRLLKDLASHGLFLAQGTVTDGLARLLPLFEPIYEALHVRCLETDHWHADETRWPVFVKVEGKEGHRWYLWVFRSREAVCFVLDPSRAARVVKEFFGAVAAGIISADRYSAYKSMIELGRFLVAFCWAHVRRDVLRLGERFREHAKWSEDWIARIRQLYELNEKWLEARGNRDAFRTVDEELRLFLLELETAIEVELAAHPKKEKAKVLESMVRHWEGLTLFYAFPEIPLDNSAAERAIRGPAVARKNYYGSGSVWSGRLAAVMFSLFQTLELWGICPRKWLTRYLAACAAQRGKVPEDSARFLPWNLSEEARAALAPGAPDTG